MARPRAPACHLVRLPRAVPGGARRGRPQPDAGLRERARRDQHRGARGRPVRGHTREPDLGLALPDLRRLVDVLELRVHGRRADAAVRVRAPLHVLPPLPELDPAREHDRPGRRRGPCGGPAAHVPDVRLPRHARRVRRAQPREWPGPARLEPVRGDAEPARGRRADRRVEHALRLSAVVVEDDLAALAGMGLVRGHGDRKPLLARHPRRDRRGRDRRRRDLPEAAVAAPPAGHRTGTGLRSTGTSVKATYTDGARRLASLSISGLARTRVTPSMLTLAGVTLCALASVLVYFEYKNEW